MAEASTYVNTKLYIEWDSNTKIQRILSSGNPRLSTSRTLTISYGVLNYSTRAYKRKKNCPA